MQTIYLDISNKGVVSTVYAKQNDVGRKFAVILTDSGLPYIPEIGSVFSVWYKGASGEGNYTDIGNKSAFSFNGNKVEVEMIVQMLSAHGDGILCLTLNSPDGNQISSWNIPYMCEMVPGSESEKAEEYYTAFSKAVEELPYPDETLSISGKAADSDAVGKSLAKKADISYTKKICNPHNLLDNSNFANPINQRGAARYTGTVYTIDRWRSRAAGFTIVVGNSKISATLADSHTSDYAALMQYVPREKIKAGEKYTLACCTDSGKIYCFVVTAQSETASGTLNPVGDNAYLELAFDGTNYRFNMNVIRGRAISLLWAALYEGEYTLETLPKYQSKGYGAELMECQRYYQIRSTNNIAAVDMRPTMRLSSPTINSVTGGYAYSADL